MGLKRFIEEVRTGAKIDSTAKAEKTTKAAFNLLSARLTRREGHDMTSQLESDIREFWGSVAEKEVDVVKLDLEGFLSSLRERAGLKDRDEAEKAASAVFSALKARISSGEAWDVECQLPEGLKELWKRS